MLAWHGHALQLWRARLLFAEQICFVHWGSGVWGFGRSPLKVYRLKASGGEGLRIQACWFRRNSKQGTADLAITRFIDVLSQDRLDVAVRRCWALATKIGVFSDIACHQILRCGPGTRCACRYVCRFTTHSVHVCGALSQGVLAFQVSPWKLSSTLLLSL